MKFIFNIIISLMLACSGDQPPGAPLPADDISGMQVQTLEIPQTMALRENESKLVKESYVRFETDDLEKTYKDIIACVKENEGYIQNDESNREYGQHSRKLVSRVPSKNFQKTLDAISKNISFFDERNVTSTDVTEEYIDIGARLRAKQSLEKRYMDLLAKAQNVKEILEIEKELSVIREEIKASEGRLKYLENRVSYSTLTVTFYKPTAETGITISYGTKMWNALKAGFNGLSFFLLGVFTLWPLWIIAIAVIFFIRAKFFRKKRI